MSTNLPGGRTADLTSHPPARPTWTHQVRLTPDDPTDYRNVFCTADGDALRAVGCALKAPGQVVATWDPTVQAGRRRGAWVHRDGRTAAVWARQPQASTPTRAHRTATWLRDQPGFEGLLAPFVVEWEHTPEELRGRVLEPAPWPPRREVRPQGRHGQRGRAWVRA